MKRRTTHPRRAERRTRAEERQAYRNTLTPAQQLAVIATRRGQSKRETARLTKQMEAA